ncbi:MAG: tRNA (adenosine(37)-N6)-dimethylallyltransferase MiaA, partial [Oscillospiraceae bacterium]
EDRADLYARIDRRVDEMAEQGLFEEVQSLLDEGLSENCTAMQAIGYKEPAQALKGEIRREEAIALIKQNSRRYAKRQLTWFSRAEGVLSIRWGHQPDFEQARRLSTDFLLSRGLS